MIDAHTWPTPNGHKVHIMLEECGLAYTVHPVNIGEGDQFKPEFLAISPNNRIPAIVDRDGPGGQKISVFETGAILFYLAEKTGKFLPAAGAARYAVIEWLMWQMGGVGPMFGQANHFRNYAKEKIPYAIDRYTKESNRLYHVLDKRLATRDYVADAYSIADMAIFPWCRDVESQGIEIADYPNAKRWYERVAARPAVRRGLQVLAERRRVGPHTDKAREILFGATQFQKR